MKHLTTFFPVLIWIQIKCMVSFALVLEAKSQLSGSFLSQFTNVLQKENPACPENQGFAH